MPRSRARLLAAATTILVSAGLLVHAPATAAAQKPKSADPMAAAPYLYFGWGNPQSPKDVMAATGVKWFTLAFILSDGGCNPAWDGTRPLNGDDKAKIEEIKAAGGNVMPSVGGWSGSKLGEVCSSAEQLAGAYQKVIDAYGLKAIDVDIENTEFESDAAQDRVLGALKIVKEKNPSIKTILTFGTTQDGPNERGKRLVQKAAETQAGVDTFTIMPFDFGAGSADMGELTKKASEGLHAVLKSAFAKPDAEIYAMQGISSMNGKTDQNETVTQDDYKEMRAYAQEHALSRFTFWSLNRDRPCDGGGDPSACSGISQQPLEFTKIAAEYGQG